MELFDLNLSLFIHGLMSKLELYNLLHYFLLGLSSENFISANFWQQKKQHLLASEALSLLN